MNGLVLLGAISRTVKELVFSWKSGRKRRRFRAWNLVPLAFVWVVLEREMGDL